MTEPAETYPPLPPIDFGNGRYCSQELGEKVITYIYENNPAIFKKMAERFIAAENGTYDTENDPVWYEIKSYIYKTINAIIPIPQPNITITFIMSQIKRIACLMYGL